MGIICPSISPIFTPRKGLQAVLDSGFYATMGSEFQVVDSKFFVRGTWIPDSNRYWPGFLIPWGVFWIPKAQDSGFGTTKFPRFRDPLYVSGKLPTYPSPNSTLTLTCHLGQIWAWGRGRWAVSQRSIMIPFKAL